jgi:hypothetical protein
MIQINAFKENEKEGGEGRPQLGDPWKVPMFGGLWKGPILGGLWKGPILGGLWKVPSLVAFGRRRKSILFTYFHFPPNKFYLNLFFFIDFKVLLYHGSRPFLYTFLSFSLTYKLQPCISMYQVFTHSLPI